MSCGITYKMMSHEIHALKIVSCADKLYLMEIFSYICSPNTECGEIWLLATTQKNAKMLTFRSDSVDCHSIFMFLCIRLQFLELFLFLAVQSSTVLMI